MIFTTLVSKMKKNNNRSGAGSQPASCGFGRFIVKRIFLAIGAAVFWFIIWYALASHIDKEIILPSPTVVLVQLYHFMMEPAFWIACGNTILRIIAGTAAGIATGIVLAGLMLVSKIARTLIYPLLSAVKATPVASFIIAALFWISRGHVPAFISFLIVLPVMCDAVYTGITRADKKLLEVGRIYRFSVFKKIRYIIIPSVVPYFLSALRTSVGMAWKSGVAAEVLCTPADSIGKALNMTKVYMETTQMFAWTIMIIILSIIFEKITVWLVGKGLKKYSMMEAHDVED